MWCDKCGLIMYLFLEDDFRGYEYTYKIKYKCPNCEKVIWFETTGVTRPDTYIVPTTTA